MSISSIKKYHLLFFLLGILQSGLSIPSAKSAESRMALRSDTSAVRVRQPDPATQQELLERSEYKFDRVGPAPKTWWDRFLEWFWRTIDETFSSDGGKVGLTIIEWGLVIAVIVIVVLLLLKHDIRSAFYGKSASVTVDFREFDEDIHRINFDELIAAAVAAKDYRKAVRLHFLKLLKELTDKNLIRWQIDKTNNDYSVELQNSRYSKSFSELARLYEYTWYGDFQLDENNFNSTINKFRAFKVNA